MKNIDIIGKAAHNLTNAFRNSHKEEQNEQAKAESAIHKSLMQTVWRMKNKGYEVKEIMSITCLTTKEIEGL